MKIFFKILFVFAMLNNFVLAETFTSELKKAYETNPELNAERETLNISKQEHNV